MNKIQSKKESEVRQMKKERAQFDPEPTDLIKIELTGFFNLESKKRIHNELIKLFVKEDSIDCVISNLRK
jgi:hypothetical protein